MARLAVTATAGATSASLVALEEAYTALAAAIAVLVADGASPTQAHVTTANNALTTVTAALAADMVCYYDRATLTSPALVQQAIAAVQSQTRCIR